MADKVYKTSDYYSEETEAPAEEPIPEPQVNPFSGINFGEIALNEFAGLKDDFKNVFVAVKDFPVRSTLTVFGFLTLVYIGFRTYRKFARIKTIRSK